MFGPLTERLKEFIACDLVEDASLVIADEEDLFLSGLVDSLGVIRLIAFLREVTGIQIPPGDVTLENFSTVSAIAAYLQARGSAV